MDHDEMVDNTTGGFTRPTALAKYRFMGNDCIELPIPARGSAQAALSVIFITGNCEMHRLLKC